MTALYLLSVAFTPIEPYSIWARWDSVPSNKRGVILHVIKFFVGCWIVTFPFAWLMARSASYRQPQPLILNDHARGSRN